MQTITFSPQKHHNKTQFFCKTPCKNTNPPQDKKMRTQKQKGWSGNRRTTPPHFDLTYTVA
jgi:hypothetical protein